jgi:hypothetical protein
MNPCFQTRRELVAQDHLDAAARAHLARCSECASLVALQRQLVDALTAPAARAGRATPGVLPQRRPGPAPAWLATALAVAGLATLLLFGAPRQPQAIGGSGSSEPPAVFEPHLAHGLRVPPADAATEHRPDSRPRRSRAAAPKTSSAAEPTPSAPVPVEPSSPPRPSRPALPPPSRPASCPGRLERPISPVVARRTLRLATVAAREDPDRPALAHRAAGLAAALYRQLHEEDPRAAKAWLMGALAHYLQFMLPDQAPYRDRPRALFEFGCLLAETSRPDEARAVWATIAKSTPAAPEAAPAALAFGEYYFQVHDWNAALQFFNRVVAARAPAGDRAEALYCKAWAHHFSGDDPAAGAARAALLALPTTEPLDARTRGFVAAASEELAALLGPP